MDQITPERILSLREHVQSLVQDYKGESVSVMDLLKPKTRRDALWATVRDGALCEWETLLDELKDHKQFAEGYPIPRPPSLASDAPITTHLQLIRNRIRIDKIREFY